jgi:hypothetical protein
MPKNSEISQQAKNLRHGRPNMRSVNIMITKDINDTLSQLDERSRSAAVRYAAEIIISGHQKGIEGLIDEIRERVNRSGPAQRRENEEAGNPWSKAIVWIPDRMMNEIERIVRVNQMKPAEFLRGCVIFATENKIKG